MNNHQLYFPPFDIDESAVDVGQKWEEYLRKFNRFLDFQGITCEKRMLNGLLHVAGDAVERIYDNQLDKDVKDKSYAEVTKVLTAHFNPKRSVFYERHVFRTLKQQQDESVLSFVTRLRSAAKHCKFDKTDDEILSAVLTNGTSLWLTKKCIESALKGTDPTLATMMTLASANAISESQAREMVDSEQSEGVNYMSGAKHKRLPSSYTSPRNSYNQDSAPPCRNCGRDARHDTCPAKNLVCHACSKVGHFKSVCQSKNERSQTARHSGREKLRRSIKFVEEASDLEEVTHSFDEYGIFNINVVGSRGKTTKAPLINIVLCGKNTEFVIDTGSSLNIIDKDTFDKLTVKPELRPPICNAYRFDSNKPIKFLGRFVTELETRHGTTRAEIHVLKYTSTSPRLMSYKTANALGLIHVVQNVVNDSTKASLKAKYPNLFSGKIGCLKNFELELFEDKSIKPTRRQHYRIPYHLQPQVEALLNEREQDGLIEKATGPTTWLSACHVVPKKDPSQIRLVIDARPVNKAIIRHRHPTPTLDDIQTAMNGSKIFSKLDFKEGYRQIKLHPNSRHLTTFSTHKGLFRDTRLSPGLSAGAESFQWIVGDVIKDINNVMNVSDDIMVHGKDQASHDKALHELLERLESVGFTANLDKCEFRKKSINFFGVNFSEKGMSPLSNRVEAFQKAARPETASELRSMLASANWSSRFIKNFATIVSPLRELAKPGQTFNWTTEHDRAFDQVKKSFTVNTLAYFNPGWNTEVYSDASPVGLGAILVQVNPQNSSDRVVVAFVSRALSAHEKKYSQVELEALALIFAVERFHAYVYGKRFKLFSDAKAIVFIYGGQGNKSPARIERWGLRLLPYDFEIVHTQGDGNPADYLSRHPISLRDAHYLF